MSIVEMFVVIFVAISLLFEFYLVFQISLLYKRDKILTAEINRRLKKIKER